MLEIIFTIQISNGLSQLFFISEKKIPKMSYVEQKTTVSGQKSWILELKPLIFIENRRSSGNSISATAWS